MEIQMTELRSLRVRVVPAVQAQLPTYVNGSIVNYFSGDLVVDFTFVDPLLLVETVEGAPGIEIETTPVVRVAISLQAAQILLGQLQANIAAAVATEK